MTPPIVLVVADFNHDGRDDIVFRYALGANVSIGISTGTGTFTQAAPPGELNVINPSPTTHVSDANGDGNLDLYGKLDDNLRLWLGRGDGTFADPAIVGTTWGSWTDLDGDGRDDLVVAVNSGGAMPMLAVSTQRAQADGTLAAAVAAGSYANPTAQILTADFDGDGKGDLVIVDGAQASFYKGAGDGTFATTAESSVTLAASASCTVAGDINGDARADAGCATASSTMLLLGASNGLSAGATFSFVAEFHDWDGDKKLDALGDSRMARGNGDGTFAADESVPLRDGAYGDFDGDGRLDEVSTTMGLHDAYGALSRRVVEVDPGAGEFVVADFNRDGRMDLADVGGYVRVQLQQPDGTFALHSLRPATTEYASRVLGAGDFDGDGIVDLVAYEFEKGMVLGRGDGTGNFSWTTQDSGGYAPLAVGDFDGDGLSDVALGGCGGFTGACTVAVCFSRAGAATLDCAPMVTLPSNSPPIQQVEAADLDGDGRAEILVAMGAQSGGPVYVSFDAWRGGDATFMQLLSAASSPYGNQIAVADVDGDGLPDVVSPTSIWFSSLGLVTPASVINLAPRIAGDLDGDGYADVLDYGFLALSVRRGSANGLLPARSLGIEPSSIGRLADMDGDGRLDWLRLSDSDQSGIRSTRVEILRNVPVP